MRYNSDIDYWFFHVCAQFKLFGRVIKSYIYYFAKDGDRQGSY